jgi:uncharacterized membrane protein YcgQ (UPF0703/DUF1980 family)
VRRAIGRELGALCALLLAGCGAKASANLPTNGGGTQAIALPESNSAPAEESIMSVPAPTATNETLLDESETDLSGDIIEIKEKMFVAQSNDVYYNTEDYLGKTLKYEGIFQGFTDPNTNITYYSVIRYGPGCCGVDANCGFEVKWVEEENSVYPALNDWVEVVGVLEEYEEDGWEYLRLNLTSLTVLPTRGAEVVTQ